jgi:sulfatase maturation enzyme AslB (radical SAM superfamily)
MTDLYCSMIHGGLYMELTTVIEPNKLSVGHCCLRTELFPVNANQNFWNDPKFTKLRNTNNQNIWDEGCSNCKRLEASNNESFRTGMNQGLQMFGQKNTSGPARIDLKFDVSCNLACRICSPRFSTYWQRHLKEHGLWNLPVLAPNQKNEAIEYLSQLDLSNLRQLVFCGGETLMGKQYWDVAEWLAENVPNAKQQLTLCFQTNGTQPIHEKNHKIIEKFHLVKLHVSLDGVGKKFEYMRWPAKWDQVTDNILTLRQTLPSNVMFVVEETISIFNLYYLDELNRWVKNNFTQNKEGDIINHTRHMVNGYFTLDALTQEYVDAVQPLWQKNLVPAGWKEDPEKIKKNIEQIRMFDEFRNESFEQTFPEIKEFYARFW